MGRDKYKVIFSVVVFFIIFVFYAFWSVPYVNLSPSIIGPIFRSLIVFLWLFILLLILSKKWNFNSVDNIKAYFFRPTLVIVIFLSASSLIFGRLDFSFKDITALMPVFTYIFIAALSCGVWETGFIRLLSWVLVIIFQLLIDGWMENHDFYGNFPSFHI